MPGERITDPGSKPFADAFFLTPHANLNAFGVTEGDPHPDAILAFLLNLLGPRRMRLRKMNRASKLPEWVVEVLAMDSERGEVIRVTATGDQPKVSQGQPVRIEELEA